MALTRFLGMTRAMGLRQSDHPRPSCSSLNYSSCSSMSSSGSLTKFRCLCKGGIGTDTRPPGDSERKPPAVLKAASASICLVTAEPKTYRGIDLAVLIANVSDVMLQNLKAFVKQKSWKLNIQTFVEKAVIDCRFFTLSAVAGSLLGSFLCYVEGCFLILESYLEYFHALSQRSELGHIVQRLIEAIDMFLLGTAMLIFGMGIYVMFVASKIPKGLPGATYLKTLPSRIGMQTVMEAKSKIGHAVIMILQTGLMEKFTSIPLVTALDLACFAGALFLSSACLFLLSRLYAGSTVAHYEDISESLIAGGGKHG